MKKRSVLSVLVLASMFCLAGCTNNSSQTPSSETPSSTTVSVTGVTITSANNVRSIKEGETLQLTATVLPEGANQGVTWTSSSETNATVSNTGLVTAVKAGNVTITATSTADTTKSATFSLVIEKGEDPLPTAITVTASSKEVEVGGNLTLYGLPPMKPRRPSPPPVSFAASPKAKSPSLPPPRKPRPSRDPSPSPSNPPRLLRRPPIGLSSIIRLMMSSWKPKTTQP